MSAIEIKLYDFFRKDLKLDDQRAKIFTEILYENIENNSIRVSTQYKSEIQSDLQKMEMQLRTDMQQMEMQLRAEIKDSKTDMIKWFFAFFITLVLMILGLYATIFVKIIATKTHFKPLKYLSGFFIPLPHGKRTGNIRD